MAWGPVAGVLLESSEGVVMRFTPSRRARDAVPILTPVDLAAFFLGRGASLVPAPQQEQSLVQWAGRTGGPRIEAGTDRDVADLTQGSGLPG